MFPSKQTRKRSRRRKKISTMESSSPRSCDIVESGNEATPKENSRERLFREIAKQAIIEVVKRVALEVVERVVPEPVKHAGFHGLLKAVVDTLITCFFVILERLSDLLG